MSFVTVSREREDGDFDVLVAFSADTVFESDERMSEGFEKAAHFREEHKAATGEDLVLHDVECVTDVLDASCKPIADTRVYRETPAGEEVSLACG